MSLFIFLLRLWPVLVASRLAPVAAHPQDRKLPSAGTTTTSVSSVNTAAPSQQQCEDDPKWSLTKDNWINGNTDDFVKQILSKAGPATSPNPENTVPKYLVEHYTAGVTSYICNPQYVFTHHMPRTPSSDGAKSKIVKDMPAVSNRATR